MTFSSFKNPVTEKVASFGKKKHLIKSVKINMQFPKLVLILF